MKQKTVSTAIFIIIFILLFSIASTYRRAVYNRQQNQITELEKKNNELKEVCQELERDINELSTRNVIVPLAEKKLDMCFPDPNDVYNIYIKNKEKLRCTFVDLMFQN